jgi:hypothetical protein
MNLAFQLGDDCNLVNFSVDVRFIQPMNIAGQPRALCKWIGPSL